MTEGEYQRIALGISLGDGLGHNLGEDLDHVVAIAHTSGAGVIGLAVQADVVATLAGDGGDDAHLLAFHLEGVALLDVELQECLDVVERTRVGGANAKAAVLHGLGKGNAVVIGNAFERGLGNGADHVLAAPEDEGEAAALFLGHRDDAKGLLGAPWVSTRSLMAR